jgi:hypothetical protein
VVARKVLSGAKWEGVVLDLKVTLPVFFWKSKIFQTKVVRLSISTRTSRNSSGGGKGPGFRISSLQLVGRAVERR